MKQNNKTMVLVRYFGLFLLMLVLSACGKEGSASGGKVDEALFAKRISEDKALGFEFVEGGKVLVKAPQGVSGYDIPYGVTTIEKKAFYKCTSLMRITIPDTVTTIGADAFYGCKNLDNVKIPSSVTSIGFDAFLGTRCNLDVRRAFPDYKFSGWGDYE